MRVNPSISQYTTYTTVLYFGGNPVIFHRRGAKFDVPIIELSPCPSDIIVPTDEGVCGAIVEYVDPDEGFQTLGMSSGTTFPVGTTLNAFKEYVSVENQLTALALCSFDVTVTALTCPENNIVVDMDQDKCSKEVMYDVTITDNCPEASLNQLEGIASGQAFPGGITTNTFFARVDGQIPESCSFDVTVHDRRAPILTCPESNIEVDMDQDKCSKEVIYDVTVTDNCPEPSLAQVEGIASGQVFPAGVTTNTFVASDSGDESDACSFDVTVYDRQAPTLTNCSIMRLCGGKNRGKLPKNSPCTFLFDWDAVDKCMDSLSIEAHVESPCFSDPLPVASPGDTIELDRDDCMVSGKTIHPELKLVVTAIDVGGNSVTCEAQEDTPKKKKKKEKKVNKDKEKKEKKVNKDKEKKEKKKGKKDKPEKGSK